MYNLPQYILKIKNNHLRSSLEVFKNQKLFFNLADLNNLIRFWIKEAENTQKYFLENHYINSSIHELLILENFYNSNKLIKIADLIYKNSNLSSHEYLLLAGFYFRVNNLKKLKKLLRQNYQTNLTKII